MMILLKLKERMSQLRAAFPEVKRSLKSVNAIVRSIDRIMLQFAWVGAAIQGLSALGTFAVLGVVLDKVASGYLTDASTSSVILAIAGVTIYFLLSALITEFTEWRGEIFDDKLEYFLEQRIVEKLLSLDLGRITDPEFLALKESAERRGKNAVGRLFKSQTQLVAAFIGVFVTLSVIVALDPLLICLALLPVIPQTISSVLISRKRRALWEENHILRRRRSEYEWCLSEKRMLSQVKLFRFTQYVWSRYRYFTGELRAKELHVSWFNFKGDLLIRIIEVAILACAMFYLAQGFVNHEMTLTKLFFFLGAMRSFSSSLSRISWALVDLSSTSKDYDYLEKFLAVEPLIDESKAEEYRFTSIPTLTLDGVSFAYPCQTSRLALNHCSITIEPGERVAIVGRNGSGKTTIIRLLTKIFVPSGGQITIDGISANLIRQESWLDHILYATQDSTIPDFPIKEALTGTSPDCVDMDRLTVAAQMSGAHDFIQHLPDGYATQIGEEWPGGVGFSSGQLQRLKLTAAFYRLLDPVVYIGLFDEPMAHCDVETRERFYRALKGMSDKTIVVVAHDPLYLQHFERVIVMDEGRVANDLRGAQAIETYRNAIAMSLSHDF